MEAKNTFDAISIIAECKRMRRALSSVDDLLDNDRTLSEIRKAVSGSYSTFEKEESNHDDQIINYISKALDFKLYCEAKDSVLGGKDFLPIWENINLHFEALNSNRITIDRMQEVVKGYILFLSEPTKQTT